MVFVQLEVWVRVFYICVLNFFPWLPASNKYKSKKKTGNMVENTPKADRYFYCILTCSTTLVSSYNIGLWQLCTCDHHDKSSNHLSPHKIIMILLTILPVSTLHSHGICILYWEVCISFSPIYLPPFLLSTSSLFSVSISLFLYSFVFRFHM